MMKKITLEDKGQDLLWLVVNELGFVTDAGPYQKDIWVDAYIPIGEMLVIGEPCPIHHPPIIRFGYLRYKVESIIEIE